MKDVLYHTKIPPKKIYLLKIEKKFIVTIFFAAFPGLKKID